MWQKTRAADLRGALLATLGSGVVSHLLPCQHHQEQPQVSGRGRGGRGGGKKALRLLLFQHYRTQNVLNRRNRNQIEVTIHTLYSLVTAWNICATEMLQGKCMLGKPSGNMYREKTDKNKRIAVEACMAAVFADVVTRPSGFAK